MFYKTTNFVQQAFFPSERKLKSVLNSQGCKIMLISRIYRIIKVAGTIMEEKA